ncbi:MAG: hypothetical protein II779_07535, partial [Clostridia bacterium]|nr:hypothetical protein [Clostridia bacterium]
MTDEVMMMRVNDHASEEILQTPAEAPETPARGADRRTPSIPQYFSWINNTWEGSTERQTMINLDFFDWLKRT